MLWICDADGVAYSVGAPACPQCGSTEYHEEGSDMAKISVHGGASNAALAETADETADEPVVAPLDEPEPIGTGDDDVPAGTVDDVVAWTEADENPPTRLSAALDAENAKDTPRVTLVTELERRLSGF